MTCFWDSILISLTPEDHKIVGTTIHTDKQDFIKQLKFLNKKPNTLWQNSVLREQEKQEHFIAVQVYDPKKINEGHLTSVCDSFLLLLCDLLQINIEHHYLNMTTILYSCYNPRKTLRFQSSRDHFSKNTNIL